VRLAVEPQQGNPLVLLTSMRLAAAGGERITLATRDFELQVGAQITIVGQRLLPGGAAGINLDLEFQFTPSAAGRLEVPTNRFDVKALLTSYINSNQGRVNFIMPVPVRVEGSLLDISAASVQFRSIEGDSQVCQAQVQPGQNPPINATCAP
jgi:hypothetical protein